VILTNKAKYATIAVIEILESGDKPTSLSSIALTQNISLSFLEQIFSSLKKEGIVKSVRGASGGYILAQDPENIKVLDVITAVDEQVKMTRCATKDGCIGKGIKCKTHNLWKGLEKNIHTYLSGISIASFKQEEDAKNLFR
jgi:Rrf2 family iron-sulfur cluster assembly transcriptional regulator